jgi:hypothetical protein
VLNKGGFMDSVAIRKAFNEYVSDPVRTYLGPGFEGLATQVKNLEQSAHDVREYVLGSFDFVNQVRIFKGHKPIIALINRSAMNVLNTFEVVIGGVNYLRQGLDLGNFQLISCQELKEKIQKPATWTQWLSKIGEISFFATRCLEAYRFLSITDLATVLEGKGLVSSSLNKHLVLISCMAPIGSSIIHLSTEEKIEKKEKRDHLLTIAICVAALAKIALANVKRGFFLSHKEGINLFLSSVIIGSKLTLYFQDQYNKNLKKD